MAERYTETGVWSLLCGAELGGASPLDSRKGRCASRYYQLTGDWDLQGLVYYDDDTGLSMGGGFSVVTNETTEWHGSIRWQQRYHRLDYRPQPVMVEHSAALKALLGFTYTTASGYSLIAEVWHNGTVHVDAGAGIVADSVAELETAETEAKAVGLLRALGPLE